MMRRLVVLMAIMGLLSMDSIVLAEDEFVYPNQRNTEEPADAQGHVETTVVDEAPMSQPMLQQQPVVDLNAQIQVNKSISKLAQYSSRKYRQVTYTIANTSPAHVELLQAFVQSGVPEETLAAEKARSSRRKRRGFGALMRTASIVPGVTAASGGGYHAVRAASYGARAANNVAYVVENTADGGMAITGQFVNRVNNVVLAPNQTFTFSAIIPKAAPDTLQMVLKDLQANTIMDVNK